MDIRKNAHLKGRPLNPNDKTIMQGTYTCINEDTALINETGFFLKYASMKLIRIVRHQKEFSVLKHAYFNEKARFAIK